MGALLRWSCWAEATQGRSAARRRGGGLPRRAGHAGPLPVCLARVQQALRCPHPHHHHHAQAAVCARQPAQPRGGGEGWPPSPTLRHGWDSAAAAVQAHAIGGGGVKERHAPANEQQQCPFREGRRGARGGAREHHRVGLGGSPISALRVAASTQRPREWPCHGATRAECLRSQRAGAGPRCGGAPLRTQGYAHLLPLLSCQIRRLFFKPKSSMRRPDAFSLNQELWR